MVRFSLLHIPYLRLRPAYFLGLFRFGHYWLVISETELSHGQVEVHREIHHGGLWYKHSWHLSHLHQLLHKILHHIRGSWCHHLCVIHYFEPLALFHLLILWFPAAATLDARDALLLLTRYFTAAL